ncbi:MAG: sulfite exporter TauE/SafE family protein [Actinomycetota bacterium]|jgi:cytochrome c-type biogenesis protein|nr:sulfite exporter TauE/SafE family protein [Actinomycetota bacterium]MDA8302167.1 sulfite exporter TauE/SafE family protein [Actinomycetota bacterium]
MTPLLLPLFALVGGMISFTSPCCLPLLPGYVSYISGLPVSELGRVQARALTLRAALLFVAGFTLVFTVLGVAAGLLGSLVVRELPLVMDIAGAGMIVLGLAMAGVLRIPWLFRERRFALHRLPSGPKAAFGVGMAFAAGWTPCIGPVLATILATAAATRTAAWGALLLALFSVGLGLPFIALALGLTRAKGSLAWLRRHGRAIEVLGGLLLVGVGVLFVTGAWRSFFVPLQREFARFGWPPV